MQRTKTSYRNYSIRFNWHNGLSLPTFLIILFFILIHNVLFAQQVNFQNFGTRENLSSNQVYQIYQDKNGVLWFATDRGLSSYNGYEFKQYGLNDGLTSTTVFSFFAQDNGKIWCTTIENRLFYFNPDDCIFHAYRYNELLESASQGAVNADLEVGKDESIKLSFVNSPNYITIDKNGKLSGDGVDLDSRTDNVSTGIRTETSKGSDDFVYKSYLGINITDTIISNVCFYFPGMQIGRYNKIKIGSKDVYIDFTQIYIISDGKLLKRIALKKAPISIGIYDDEHFWVGYRNGGVRIYDISGKLSEEHLDGESVTYLLQDHENGIWISTLSSGVYYTSNSSFYRYDIEKVGISHLSVLPDGNLGIGLMNGNLYNGHGSSFLKSEISSEFPVLRNYYTSYGELIRYQDLATNENFTNLELSGKYINWFRYVTNLSDEQDELPIICSHNQFFIIDKKRTLRSFQTTKRVNDACFIGDMIFLAKNEGIFIYDTLTRKEKQSHHEQTNSRITDIDRFRKTGVIAATRGKGVYIRSQGKSSWITMEHGLTSDLVTEVYVENDSTIWACTNLGLNRIVFKPDGSCKINTITQESGLIDNDITDVVVLNGIVWVGTRRGLSSFPLRELSRKSLNPKMFLRFTGIKVNDKIVNRPNQLNYNENRIEINYQAVSFKMKGLIYRYRLKGLASEWNETKNLKVIYDALAPGDYLFQVQAGFKGEWFGNEMSLPFHISPPFYQSWWFRILLILVTGGLIYLFFRYRILVYNRNIIREILRQLLKRIKKETATFVVESNNKLIKINSPDVMYVQAHRNYIEIKTKQDRILIREKISNFRSMVPDPIEYVQINRSCIVRIDNVSAKTKNSLIVNQQEFKIGSTYLDAISKIHF